MLGNVRLAVQHLSFVILMYGGRFGVHLGSAVPCFSCPYVYGCGGNCYLMGLQGYIGFGLTWAQLWGYQGLRALFWLVVFAAAASLLGKLWCGFVCPFGLVSDWLTYLRRFLGVASLRLSRAARARLAPVKYFLLAWLALGPVLVNLGLLHPDFYLPFCQICPGKSLLPLFEGEAKYLTLELTNSVTLSLSVVLMAASGLTVAGSFFRERLFCVFCPMLALFNLLRPLALARIVKDPGLCQGCGACSRSCMMDMDELWLEREHDSGDDGECLGCGGCVEACSSRGCLSLKFLGGTVVGSSPELARGLRTGGGRARG
ncbi:MAG: 4Fe-4S binding protein [Deltaproteobacteria bacterium]|jgi:polyferredoxin|nr:4Fe-4S binding protein [Deltaproteobacteria bacterium]